MYCGSCGARIEPQQGVCPVCGAPCSGLPDWSVSADGAYGQGPGATGMPPSPMPTPVAADRPKGCLACALDDATATPYALRRTLHMASVPAAISFVAVLSGCLPVAGALVRPAGLACALAAMVCCTGYGMAWGRSLLGGQGIEGISSPLRASLLSLGFFGVAIGLLCSLIVFIPSIIMAALGLAGGMLGASISLVLSDVFAAGAALAAVVTGIVTALLVVLTVVLNVVALAMADTLTMHLATTGRMESLFSVRRVFGPIKGHLPALLCASALPMLAAAGVIAVVAAIAIALADAASSYPFSIVRYLGVGGAVGLIFDGGLLSTLLLALVAAVASFALAAASMVRLRAMGYWAQRFAPSWAREPIEDWEVPIPGVDDVEGMAERARSAVRNL